MEKRVIDVTISDRKSEEYTTLLFKVEFENVSDLIETIDGLIETETDFRKADVSVDDFNKELTNEEIDHLESEFIFVS